MQYFFRFFSQKSVIIGQNQQIKAEFYWQDAPFPFLSPFVSRCCIQSFRLYKTFCSHKRRGKWPFVEVCKGTKAVPLPLLCASFFSQKKGQLPVFDGAAGKLPQSACAASPLKEGAKYSYKNSPSLLIQTGGAFKVLITAKVRLYPAWTVPPASRPDGRCGSSSRPASRQHTAHAAGHRQTAQ